MGTKPFPCGCHLKGVAVEGKEGTRNEGQKVLHTILGFAVFSILFFSF